MKLLHYAGGFFVGGSAYVGLDLLWRGRSHGSMFVAGGTCFLLLGELAKRERLPLPVKAVCGAAAITAVELVVGLLVNKDHRIWDYRHMPANFKGQICLPYSLLWIPVSTAGLLLHKVVSGKPRP